MKRVNVIGNGDFAQLYLKDDTRSGLNVICNMPPFTMQPKDVYASFMVDFKMMKALTEGSLNLGMYNWVLGNRPKRWMESKQSFYMKYASNIKDFYLDVPKYADNATSFNCGHMAVHYSCNKLEATELHMYGFDSLFDPTVRSITDLYLNSVKDTNNSMRLLNTWRPIWQGIFNEFSNTTFVLHHKHDHLKFDVPKNVNVISHKEK